MSLSVFTIMTPPQSAKDRQPEFISLITQHQASLRAYIISLMPGQPGAADVLQNTNLILWEKKKAYQPGSNFLAWAFTIARFEAKNYKRKLQRQQPILEIDEDLLYDLSEHCVLDPRETEERMLALENCLTKLRPAELELVQSRYMDDTTLVDYAERVGRQVGSLRVTLHRIRKGLRQCISFHLISTKVTP